MCLGIKCRGVNQGCNNCARNNSKSKQWPGIFLCACNRWLHGCQNSGPGHTIPYHTMCHVSSITCQMSHFTCRLSCFTFQVSHVTCFFLFFSFRKWWSQFVEGLLSMGPTPSSFQTFSYLKKYVNTLNLVISACSGPFLVIKKPN